MTRPDIEAIAARYKRLESRHTDIPALLAYIAELLDELARVTKAQHAAVIGWDAEREVVERLRREVVNYDSMLVEEHNVRMQSEAERDAVKESCSQAAQDFEDEHARFKARGAELDRKDQRIAELELALRACEAAVDSQAARIADLEEDLAQAREGHANAH